MTDCAICRRHHPDLDGDCTDRCRHVDATIGDLCQRCHLGILRNLTTITEAWELSAQGSVSTGRGTSSEVGLPGGTEWLNWRAGGEVIGTLNDWCITWHEDIPDVEFPTAANRNDLVPVLCQWLRVHMHDVGCRHEYIKLFDEEIAGLAALARRIIGDVPPGQVVICPGIVETCGARLRVDIAADPHAEVYCRKCSTTWTPIRLMLYGVEGATDMYWPLDFIELYCGVPRRTQQRWGRQGSVRRNHAGEYHVGDVVKMRDQSRQMAMQGDQGRTA